MQCFIDQFYNFNAFWVLYAVVAIPYNMKTEIFDACHPDQGCMKQFWIGQENFVQLNEEL